MKYEINNEKARITGFLSHHTVIEVPREIGGCEVTEIGDYAFSQQSAAEEIILPDSVRKIGRYAFYNCRNLRRIQFYNTLRDIGAGAFTGCHSVREIEITFRGDEQSCLRELLTELPEEQTLIYHSGNGEARLVFPEFFEEAVENTPARILETHTHGSGMMYRNCFVQKKLQFHLYDERFEWAKGREFEDTLFRLVFNRLLYPYELKEKAEKKYRAFLKEHFEACAVWAAGNMLEREIHYLTEHCAENAEELEILTAEAGKRGNAEMTGYLMDYKHRNYRSRKKTFEL